MKGEKHAIALGYDAIMPRLFKPKRPTSLRMSSLKHSMNKGVLSTKTRTCLLGWKSLKRATKSRPFFTK